MFSDEERHLIVVAPEDAATVIRQVRRKDGKAISIPLWASRVLLTTVPITNRQRTERSARINDPALWDSVTTITSLKWRKSQSKRVSTTPRSLLHDDGIAEGPTDTSNRPVTIDLGTIQRPDRFLDALDRMGVHYRRPGRAGEIHINWCGPRLLQLLEDHNHRPPDGVAWSPEDLHHGWGCPHHDYREGAV